MDDHLVQLELQIARRRIFDWAAQPLHQIGVRSPGVMGPLVTVQEPARAAAT
jgi:hypothetical protein